MKLTISKLKQLVKEALEIHSAPAGLTDMDAKTAYDDREEDAMWAGYVELHKELYGTRPDTEDMTYDEMMLAYKKLEDYSALKEHAKTRAKGSNHMKLTKSKLKQIIKEEIEKSIQEGLWSSLFGGGKKKKPAEISGEYKGPGGAWIKDQLEAINKRFIGKYLLQKFVQVGWRPWNSESWAAGRHTERANIAKYFNDMMHQSGGPNITPEAIAEIFTNQKDPNARAIRDFLVHDYKVQEKKFKERESRRSYEKSGHSREMRHMQKTFPEDWEGASSYD